MATVDKKVIHTVIDLQCSVHGPKHAVVTEDGKSTYEELFQFSNQIAHSLIQLGIVKGDVVATYLPSCIGYIASLLGNLKAAAIHMPLEIGHPHKRLLQQLGQATPKVLITNDSHLDSARKLVAQGAENAPKILLIGEECAAIRLIDGNNEKVLETVIDKLEPVLSQNDGDDSAYLMYTSGSTGVPKAIEGVQKGLSHFIHWQHKEFKLETSAKVSQLAPVSFDVSLRDILLPLFSGGTLFIPDKATKATPEKLYHWLQKHEITHIHTVPTVFRLLTKMVTKHGRFNYLKTIFLAGEALYGSDVAGWYNANGKKTELINLYGPSETTLAKLFYRVKDLPMEKNSVIPLGNPISNTAAMIIHEGDLCEVDEIGEIYIKTPFRSKGYFKNGELTAEKFVQNPLHDEYVDIVYKTGDLGKFNSHRELLFVGRKDNQIKIRGNRVELSEVEETIRGYKGIGEVVIQALNRPGNEKALVCYFQKTEGVDEAGMRSFLSESLPTYMCPAYYVAMDTIPVNLNGKVDRKQLPSPEEMLYETLDYVAPTSTLEKALAEVWKEVLGLSKVGVNHTFFQLGGHSLTATRIVTKIYELTGKQLSLKDFFEHATILSLAKLIAAKKNEELTAIPKVKMAPYYPLTHAQKQFWIIDQLTNSASAYHMAGGMRLKGKLNEHALESGLYQLMERHEILRTSFTLLNGVPMQEVASSDTLKIALNTIDISAKPDKEKALEEIASNEATISFDLSKAPLFRVQLVKLSTQEHVLLVNLHHIISDGWSVKVFVKELFHYYENSDGFVQKKLPSLPIQYKDYANWHLNKFASDTRLKDYWTDKLSSDVHPLKLPVDKQPTTIRSFEGSLARFKLGQESSAALRSLSQKTGVTLFSTLIALVKTLLFKYDGAETISVGTPILGRDHPQLENQIGLYLNVVVLRDTLLKAQSFSKFLGQVKNTVLEAYEHQDYPYDKLVEDLGKDLQGEKNPLYDVLVVLNTQELLLDSFQTVAEGREDSLQTEPYVSPHFSSKLDLSFFFEDTADIGMNLEYRTDLFSTAAMESIAADFKDLVSLVVAFPEYTLAQIKNALMAPKALEQQQRFQKAALESFDNDF